MIGNEIEKRNQFREQSVPLLSKIQAQEIETAHKSVVSPCFPHVSSPCFHYLLFSCEILYLANEHFLVENQQFSIQLHEGIVSWVQLQKR